MIVINNPFPFLIAFRNDNFNSNRIENDNSHKWFESLKDRRSYFRLYRCLRRISKSLESKKSKYVLPAYKVYFDDQLANKFKPIAYLHECLSGDPEELYYRIVKRVDGEELCIQYYFYWLYQKSIVAHIYDYDPSYFT